MANKKRSTEEIIQAVKSYLGGQGSMVTYAEALGVKPCQFYEWVVKYQIFGSAGLLPNTKRMQYSLETKQEAVEEYLNGDSAKQKSARSIKLKTEKHSEIGLWCIIVIENYDPAEVEGVISI